MLFFGYSYKNKKGEKFYLHVKRGRGGNLIYYFSKNPFGAIPKPPNFKVIETKSGLPMLKKIR